MAPRTRTSIPLAIASSGTVSDAADLQGYDIVAVQIPSAWTAASVTFQTSSDGINYFPVKKVDGTALTLTVVASDWAVVPAEQIRGFGRFVKVVSSAAQAAARTVLIHGAT